MNRNLQLLATDIAQGKSIALFCGAGINCNPRIPLGWADLINGAFRLALSHISQEKDLGGEYTTLLYQIFQLEDITPNFILDDTKEDAKDGKKNKLDELHKLQKSAIAEFPFEIRTSILKRVHGRQYIPLLKSYIYSSCNETKIRKSFYYNYARKDKYKQLHPSTGYEVPKPLPQDEEITTFHTLYVLAKFILLYDKLEAVITYNYDNFLTVAVKIIMEQPEVFFYKPEYEQLKRKWGDISTDHLGRPKVKIVDVDGDNFKYSLGNHDIAVFHVHGFIPPPGDIRIYKDTSIILSQDEYNDSVNYQQRWQNATQMHYLCHCTCIFAGSSMTDLTVKRMISLAQQHGNDENIYNLDCLKMMNNSSCKPSNIAQTGRFLLDLLKRDYLSDIGVNSISYNGKYEDLYEEFGKIVYLKSAGNLKVSQINN